jgi:hypothetical protein
MARVPGRDMPPAQKSEEIIGICNGTLNLSGSHSSEPVSIADARLDGLFST